MAHDRTAISGSNTISGSNIWRIPELSALQATYLCSGYIRIEFEDAYHIPNDIAILCTNFFHTNRNILTQYLPDLRCKICHLNTIKFIFSFNTGDTATDLSPKWNISVPYLPKNIVKIELDVHMEILGTTLQYKQHCVLVAGPNILLASYIINSSSSFAAEITHLNALQLKLEIFNMQQYDKNNHIIHPYASTPHGTMTYLTYPSSAFVWRMETENIHKIQKASAGVYITSALFLCESFKWMVKISYYDIVDADLCMYLAALSPQIERLCIYYRIDFEEIERFTDGTHVFSVAEGLSLWKIDFFKSAEIKDLLNITIKIEISIMDIFYSDDYKQNAQTHTNNTSLTTINGQYVWKIDEPQAVSNLKSAGNGEDCISPLFELRDSDFKWCLKAYPNGYSTDNIGKMNTFLRFVSHPPTVASLCVHYEIELIEANIKFAAVETFSFDSPSFGWTANLLATDDVKHCQTFTFKVNIKIIDIFDNNGDIMTDKYRHIQHAHKHNTIYKNMRVCKNYRQNPYVYQWKVNDLDTVNRIKAAVNGMNFLSSIFTLFGMKWYLEFMPVPCDYDPEYDDKTFKNDYSVLYLCAASISPNIHVIRINYTLALKETNTIYKNCSKLDGCFSTGWSNTALKRKEIDDLDSFTFGVSLNFIDIYDKNGQNITDEHISYDADIEHEEKGDIGLSLNTLLTDTFEWKIDDNQLMEKIKTAENAQFFMSDMFVMHGLKWKMKIYSNGTKPQRKGIFNWYFNLISMPPNISKVSLFYKIVETESGAMDVDKTSMRCDSSQFGWGQNKLKLNDILKFDKLCFVLDITIIDIFDKSGRKLNMKEYDKIPLQSESLDESEWKLNEIKWRIVDEELLKNIKKAHVGESFKSGLYDIDGYKWFLQLAPNGMNKEEKGETKLFISIEFLPDNVESISFYFELRILESKISYSNHGHFRDDGLSKSWLTSQIKIAQLQDLNQLTLTAKMKIVDVYHK